MDRPMLLDPPTLMPGLPPLPEGWKMAWDPDEEWRPTNPNHPAALFAKKHMMLLQPDWGALPKEVTAAYVPVFYTVDVRGETSVAVEYEPRIFKVGSPPPTRMAPNTVASDFWLINRPKGLDLFAQGKFQEAMEACRDKASSIHRGIFVRARAALETEAAFKAFETLFQHYSFNEELWRVERWMDVLPFDLEEHPEMDHYRELMHKQIGHLRGGEPRMNPKAIAKWYADGSPTAGIDDMYIQAARYDIPKRVEWLVEECRKEGFKRVAEWGSVEGVNLFPLLDVAPDIQWTGFESSQVAVAHGHRLAREQGIKDFNLEPMGKFGVGPWSNYDAVALFEVLEHNTPEGGLAIAKQCIEALRPGGVLYITTPCGNWSGHDEHTRDLKLQKDHILAYTVERMRRFLLQLRDVAVTEDVHYQQNENIREGNGWVFSRVRRRV